MTILVAASRLDAQDFATARSWPPSGLDRCIHTDGTYVYFVYDGEKLRGYSRGTKVYVTEQMKSGPLYDVVLQEAKLRGFALQ